MATSFRSSGSSFKSPLSPKINQVHFEEDAPVVKVIY